MSEGKNERSLTYMHKSMKIVVVVSVGFPQLAMSTVQPNVQEEMQRAGEIQLLLLVGDIPGFPQHTNDIFRASPSDRIADSCSR